MVEAAPRRPAKGEACASATARRPGRRGRIVRQLQRIEHREAKGQDTELARDMLLALEHSLLVMQE
jgi:hypothetical protein